MERQGLQSTHAPSTYKIPATGDTHEHFKVDLWPGANREDNVGASKAVGEPPFMLAISVWEAMRAAVGAGKADHEPEVMIAPATAANVLKVVRYLWQPVGLYDLVFAFAVSKSSHGTLSVQSEKWLARGDDGWVTDGGSEDGMATTALDGGLLERGPPGPLYRGGG